MSQTENCGTTTQSVHSDNSLSSVKSVASVMKGILVTNSKQEQFALSLSSSLPVLVSSGDKQVPSFVTGRKYLFDDERSVSSELTDVTSGVMHHTLSVPEETKTDITVTSAFADSIQSFHSDTVRPMREQLLNAWQYQQGSEEGRRARNIRLLREKYHFPNGLAKQMCKNIYEFPLRIWLIDNSGSMKASDGMKYVSGPGRANQSVRCTRWDEMKDAVKFHAQLAVDLGSPTVFRFLIDPALSCPDLPRNLHQSIGFYAFDETPSKIHKHKHQTWFIDVDNTDEITPESLQMEQKARNSLRQFENLIDQITPKYTTPLNANLHEVYERLIPLRDRLECNQEMVCIVIATDGIPDNVNDFYEVMNKLHTIPCWIVIRLCTGDDETNHFWKTLDLDLDIRVDVIDDFLSEAKEVKSCNPWINYAHPLHIAREWGFHRRILDLLDECKFSIDQMREFCSMLFGVLTSDLNPDNNWEEFYYDIISLIEREGPQWNPLTNSFKNWVDMRELGKAYGGKAEYQRLKKKSQQRSSKNTTSSLLSLPEDASYNENKEDSTMITSTETKICCTIS